MPRARPTSPQLAPARRSRRTSTTIAASTSASRPRTSSRSPASRVSSAQSRPRGPRLARAAVADGALEARRVRASALGTALGAGNGPEPGGSTASMSDHATDSAARLAATDRSTTRSARSRRPLPIAALPMPGRHDVPRHRQRRLPPLKTLLAPGARQVQPGPVKFAGRPSWRASLDLPQHLHLAVFVRDAYRLAEHIDGPTPACRGAYRECPT